MCEVTQPICCCAGASLDTCGMTNTSKAEGESERTSERGNDAQ